MLELLASIPSPGFNTISLGPLEIHLYGIFVAAGVAAAFTLTRRRWERFGGDPDLADRLMVWTVVGGFLGARLAYASTHLDRFDGRPWAILFIWEGGLAFFGGLTFGAATAIYLLRRWDLDVPRFADAAAPALPLAQAIGRWGNYFNQELFGTPSDLPWALEIAPRNRPLEFAGSPTFHPTFLYESLYNLAVFGLLLTIERRRELRRGSLVLLYLVFYGIGRFLLELIRTDTTFRLFGLSRNAWVALLVAGLGAGWFVWRERRGPLPGEDDPADEGTASPDHTGATTGPGDADMTVAAGTTTPGGEASSDGATTSRDPGST